MDSPGKDSIPPTSPAVSILWTGGWDSTFFVLSLLTQRKVRVQPYYVIHSERMSTGRELRAMKEIKKRLFAERPEIQALLQPTRFIEVSDIPANERITASFLRLRDRYSLGSQYDWLARLAQYEGLTNVGLGIVQRPHGLQAVVRPFLLRSEDGGEVVYRMDPVHQDLDEYTLFRYFQFSIMDLTKREMETLARRHGFAELMEMTWFCFRPRRNGTPCGVCTPCGVTIEEGLGRRLPLTSRLRHRLRLSARARAFLAGHPSCHAITRGIKRILTRREASTNADRGGSPF